MLAYLHMETYFDCQKALSLLKAGYVLKTFKEGKAVYRKGGKIVIKGERDHIALSEYAFLTLYAETLFSLNEQANDEETVDPKRDQEYYSWNQ